ncbi:hypothetical protein EOM09_04910, partial [bacterium]|nr:hypothetical protein [bacterium]
MSNEREPKAFTDKIHIFSETEDPNQFYFYREDGAVLEEGADRIAMDMYENYNCSKMFSGEITGMIMNNIRFDTSEDGKVIR